MKHSNTLTRTYLLVLMTCTMIGFSYAAQDATVLNYINQLRTVDSTLPSVPNQKGQFGYILSTIFGTSGTASGKILSDYLDLSSVGGGSSSVTSVNTRTGAVTITKSDVGLANVENTALSTWAGTSNITTLGTIATGTVPWARLSGLAIANGSSTGVLLGTDWTIFNNKLATNGNGSALTGLTATQVGLGLVNNTSDANKPVSTATQTALNLKANIASPTLTGTPTSSAPVDGDNSPQIATTAWVKANTVSAAGGVTFSTCSTTDKKQMFYECDPTLAACLVVGAYCGGGKVAGSYGGSLIVTSLTDEGLSTWWYTNTSYGNMNPATQMCWEKKTFGFDDWSLPNKEELSVLYTNKTTLGGLYTDNYWSSTESGTNLAWYQAFNDGFQSSINKVNPYRVRCIRKY